MLHFKESGLRSFQTIFYAINLTGKIYREKLKYNIRVKKCVDHAFFFQVPECFLFLLKMVTEPKMAES
jgi:hypothetical protein